MVLTITHVETCAALSSLKKKKTYANRYLRLERERFFSFIFEP